jgi:hypothetical protein
LKELRTLVELERLAVTPAQDVLFQEVDGEVVLLSLRTGEYFGLNSVGARVWVGLNGKLTWRAILEELKKVYEVPEERLIADIARFLDELGGSGLVRVSTVAQ